MSWRNLSFFQGLNRLLRGMAEVNQLYIRQSRGLNQGVITGGQGYLAAFGQFQVGGIVDREFTVSASESRGCIPSSRRSIRILSFFRSSMAWLVLSAVNRPRRSAINDPFGTSNIQMKGTIASDSAKDPAPR